MKKTLLAAVICTAAYFTAHAQTKGTNTLGIGVSATTFKQEVGNSILEIKGSSYNLGYGRFIKDNLKLGLEGNFTYSKTSNLNNDSEVNGYGGAVSLQKYFQLFNKFYAFGGAKTSYGYSKSESNGQFSPIQKTNAYFLGAYGGVSYFLSGHFALEADLLSGGMSYFRSKNSGGSETTTSSNFGVSTSGTITNLGFRVYFLF